MKDRAWEGQAARAKSRVLCPRRRPPWEGVAPFSLKPHGMDTTEQISPRYCPRCSQKTNHSKSVNSVGPDGTEVREICNRCGALTAAKMQEGSASPSGIDGTLPPEAEEHLDEEDPPFGHDSIDGPDRPL